MMTPSSSSVLFLAGGPTVPSYRFRVEQYLAGLRALGWNCDVRHTRPSLATPPPAWLRGLGRLGWRAWSAAQGLGQSRVAPVAAASVVVMQRELAPWPSAWVERRIAGAARAMVLDVDDAVHLNYALDARGRAPRIDGFAALADLILCGNEELAAYYRPLGRRVEVLPTVVDTGRFAVRDAAAADPFRLVWIGSSSTLAELEAIVPALRQVHLACPPARLRVVADRPPSFGQHQDDIPVDFVAWTPAAEAAALDDALVGLMPLRDTPFNRGKCGLKLLLYGARGVASVASPVGANNGIVAHGQTGMLAGDSAAFGQALAALLADPARAHAMGRAAAERVRAEFSVQAWLPRLHAWLAELAGDARAGAAAQASSGSPRSASSSPSHSISSYSR